MRAKLAKNLGIWVKYTAHMKIQYNPRLKRNYTVLKNVCEDGEPVTDHSRYKRSVPQAKHWKKIEFWWLVGEYTKGKKGSKLRDYNFREIKFWKYLSF